MSIMALQQAQLKKTKQSRTDHNVSVIWARRSSNLHEEDSERKDSKTVLAMPEIQPRQQALD